MDPNNFKVPFLTRKMLSFEHATTFSVRIRSKSFANSTVTIRGFTSEGVFNFNHTVVNTALTQSQTFRIPDIPIMLCVADEVNILNQGETFVTVDLLINGDKVAELCSGLVYQSKGISYPATNILDKRPGGGQLTYVAGTNPAAGAEIVEFVPSNEVWRIMAAKFTLTTDANVANRRVHLFFQTGGTGITRFYNDIDHAASLARIYNFSQHSDMVDREDNTQIMAPMPQNIILINGVRIATSTTNKQAGDQFSSISFYVERWFL